MRQISNKSHSKFLRSILTLLIPLLVFVIVACESAGSGSDSGQPYIAVISKGEVHEFWQQVKAGANAAGAELGVTVSYDGTDSEAAAEEQKLIFENVLANNPDGIALATIDTSVVIDQINEAQNRGIPIIGFDSGVPDAPPNSVAALVSTENEAGGALAADKIFGEVSGAIGAAGSGSPVSISVLVVDETVVSVRDRAIGFRDRMIELITTETTQTESDIAVVGNSELIDSDTPTSGDKIYIRLLAPGAYGSTNSDELAAEVVSRIGSENIVGIFVSSESTVRSLLEETNDGADLPGYSGLVVVGFDAGAPQKAAVESQYFLGSIVQDSYGMGYGAVTLAYEAHLGNSVSDDLSPGVYYDHTNMNDEGISNLLYE